MGNAVLQCRGYWTISVDDGSIGKVCQSEIHSALTYGSGVKVMLLHFHFRTGLPFTDSGESHVAMFCETVAFVE